MREVVVERREPTEQRKTATPEPGGDAVVLSGDVILRDIDTGRTVGFSVRSEAAYVASLGEALDRLPMDGLHNEGRLSGIVAEHRVFGTTAPVPLRRRFGCSRSRLDADFPRVSRRLHAFAQESADLFLQLAPIEHAAHDALVRGSIREPWLFGGTPWTSGVVNRASPLPYHRDAGNLKGSWSVMLGLKRRCDGGFLHLADYGVWLAIPDGSITGFDGQSVLHGVSPFTLARGGYRYTVVLYAKSGCRACLDPAEEVLRAQRLRTASEDRIAASVREARDG